MPDLTSPNPAASLQPYYHPASPHHVPFEHACPVPLLTLAGAPNAASPHSNKGKPGGKYVPSFIPPAMAAKPKAFDEEEEEEVSRPEPRLAAP